MRFDGFTPQFRNEPLWTPTATESASPACRQRGESCSPPRDRHHRRSDPVEPDPSPRLGTKAIGGRVPAPLFQETYYRRSKVSQCPRHAQHRAGRRRDKRCALSASPEREGQGAKAAQCKQGSHWHPESRDVHPTDGRANKANEGFRWLAAPCGMHDQGLVDARAEDQRGQNRGMEAA